MPGILKTVTHELKISQALKSHRDIFFCYLSIVSSQTSICGYLRRAYISSGVQIRFHAFSECLYLRVRLKSHNEFLGKIRSNRVSGPDMDYDIPGAHQNPIEGYSRISLSAA